jgi:predicted nuclease of predicted toxin-antitoxin system
VKLLLDENLSYRLVARLTETFPGTAHLDELNLRGQPDTAIWDYALKHGFVLVSKDDDFRQLSFFRGHPPKVIWLVVGNAVTKIIAELILQNRAIIEDFVNRTDDALLTLNTREKSVC